MRQSGLSSPIKMKQYPTHCLPFVVMHPRRQFFTRLASTRHIVLPDNSRCAGVMSIFITETAEQAPHHNCWREGALQVDKLPVVPLPVKKVCFAAQRHGSKASEKSPAAQSRCRRRQPPCRCMGTWAATSHQSRARPTHLQCAAITVLRGCAQGKGPAVLPASSFA
jgi:hypothetical protein